MTDVRKSNGAAAHQQQRRRRATPVFMDMHVFDERTTQLGFDTDRKRAEALNIERSRLSRLRLGQISAGADLVLDLPAKLGIKPHLLFFKEDK